MNKYEENNNNSGSPPAKRESENKAKSQFIHKLKAFIRHEKGDYIVD